MKWTNLLAGVIFLGCTQQKNNAIQALRKLKEDNTIRRASIAFEKDTLQVYPPSFYITGTNRSQVSLVIEAIVLSCTCRKVYAERWIVLPGDSLRFYIKFKPNFQNGAITIVGNLDDGRKTVFLKR